MWFRERFPQNRKMTYSCNEGQKVLTHQVLKFVLTDHLNYAKRESMPFQSYLWKI